MYVYMYDTQIVYMYDTQVYRITSIYQLNTVANGLTWLR